MLKEIEITFRKLIFHLLIFLSGRSHKKTLPDFNNISSVTFIRLNRIGDALVVTPLFSALKKRYNFQINILADRKNHFVFRNNPNIDNIIVFKKGLSGFKEALKVLNSSDIIVDLHDDVSTTVSYLVALAKTEFKFALKKENYKLFSTTVEKPDPEHTHVIDRVAKILELFLLPENDTLNVEFYPSENAIKHVNEVMINLNPDNKFHFGINISAGSDARFWGVKRYRALIETVKAGFPEVHITLLSAPSDTHLAEEISSGLCNSYHSKSFEEFAAFIAKLDLLFTPDTSTVHLASSAKIPMFGLYVKYNTTNQIWYPYQSKYDVVVTEESNFENLSEDRVIPQFLSFFENIYNGK